MEYNIMSWHFLIEKLEIVNMFVKNKTFNNALLNVSRPLHNLRKFSP